MGRKSPVVTAGRMTNYKFGDASYNVLGKLDVQVSVTVAQLFMVEAFIVDEDVPLLIFLDVMDRLKAIINL